MVNGWFIINHLKRIFTGDGNIIDTEDGSIIGKFEAPNQCCSLMMVLKDV